MTSAQRWDLLTKLIRFGLVGGTSTILYGALAVLIEKIGILPHFAIHILCYCLSLPASYMMQKTFTFRHKGAHKKAAPRFIITSASSLVISSGLFWLITNTLELPYIAGVLGVMISVPIISFLTMQFWVFLHHDDPDAEQF